MRLNVAPELFLSVLQTFESFSLRKRVITFSTAFFRFQQRPQPGHCVVMDLHEALHLLHMKVQSLVYIGVLSAELLFERFELMLKGGLRIGWFCSLRWSVTAFFLRRPLPRVTVALSCHKTGRVGNFRWIWRFVVRYASPYIAETYYTSPNNTKFCVIWESQVRIRDYGYSFAQSLFFHLKKLKGSRKNCFPNILLRI